MSGGKKGRKEKEERQKTREGGKKEMKEIKGGKKGGKEREEKRGVNVKIHCTFC